RQVSAPVRAALLRAELLTREEVETALRRLSALDDEAFVDGLYRLLLGRPADLDGLAGHVASLRDGVARLELVHVISTSQEAGENGLDASWLQGLEQRVPRLARPSRLMRTYRELRRRLAGAES